MTAAAKRPLVIAHRGASGHLPENTFPAFELAVTQRADMIEIDLHRTRDGGIVVTHDEHLDEIGGHGEIADASLEHVRGLDAGDGECVPLLDEVLDRFGHRIPLNLEFKVGTRGPYAGLERETLAAVESRGLLSQVLFSSFSDEVLATLRAQSRQARIGVLVSDREPGGWEHRAEAVSAEAVNFFHALATEENVAAAHQAGLQVNVYTVDDVSTLEVLIARGVDGIFTNLPDRMRALLSSR